MDKRILLHVCCGPCAITTVMRLREMGYEVTAWFMNPNIQPLAEYLRRREALEQCAARLNMPVIWEDAAWDITAWLRQVAGVQDVAPRRCELCCDMRMEAAWAKARELGFPAFSSSLLYSRYQPHEAIRRKGEQLAARPGGPAFVYRDFREDWQQGIDLSKAWELYRQPYCGCVYSEAERYGKKLRRLMAPSEKSKKIA